MRRQLQVILLATNKCNVNCEYCFEDKSDERLTHTQLEKIVSKLFDMMDRDGADSLMIHWQGGEIMTIPVDWFETAYDLIDRLAAARGKFVRHGLQTNMIGYHPRWNEIVRKMFGNTVGTSMDYPNLYRKLFKGGPADYNRIWLRNVTAAREAGIGVGVIAVLNDESISRGAEEFYSYFIDGLGLTDLQVNTPFPGGEENSAKKDLALENEKLGRFFSELTDIWLERGYGKGINLAPIDQLVARYSGEPNTLPCIWQANCADEFIAIDARGYVAQCDCWVTSYPEYVFGNIFECESLAEMLAASPARREFLERPVQIIDQDCIHCDFLADCHGGCPVRTFTISKTLAEKDPYCSFYKSLFRHTQAAAGRLARDRVALRSNHTSVTASTSSGPEPVNIYDYPPAASTQFVQIQPRSR